MTDERTPTGSSNIEPLADAVLRTALVDALGEQPRDIDWAAMQQRARSAAVFRLRAMSRVTPWWEQVTPWASRLLPAGAVAAAAALALAMATPRDAAETNLASATPAVYSTADAGASGDPVADAIAAPDGAALTTGAGPVDDDWLWTATANAHTAEHR